MEESINLKDILKTMRKHLVLIASLTILAITLTGLISYFVLTPVYETSSEILVNQRSAEETAEWTNQNIESDLQLIKTYSGIIKSPVVLDQVVDELNLDMTADELIESMAVSNDDQSQIVSIWVQHKDPALAVEIANTTVAVFENEIRDLMNVDNVTILSAAVLKESPVPVSPNPVLNMAIAAVVALMLGVGIAFLLENLDMTIKDQQDIKNVLGIPVLGIIPVMSEKAEIGQDDKMTAKRRGEISNGQKEKASSADSM